MNLHLPPATLLQALIHDAEEAIVCFEMDGTVSIWNAAAERLYGFSSEEILGKNIRLLIPIYELPAVEQLFQDPANLLLATPVTSERLHKQGSLLSLRIRRSMIHSDAGVPVGILERARLEGPGVAGATAEAHLRLLMDQLPVAFWTADQRLRITSHGGSGFQGMSLFRAKTPGQTVHEYLRCKEDEQTPVRQHLDALRGISSRFEFRRRKRMFEISLEPMKNPTGTIVGCIGVALDITERKKSEEEIRYQASHDGLTGLANYREFVDRLENEVRRADRSGRGFGLLLLDLDGLKTINDRLGHMAGNRALKRLARVMKVYSRGTDLAARYGGDEFGILLIDADCSMTETVAQRVREGLRRECDPPLITVSIGEAVYPLDGKTAHELLEVADRRLYQDKKAPKAQFQAASSL